MEIQYTGDDDAMKKKNSYLTIILAICILSLLSNPMMVNQVSSYEFVGWEQGKIGYELVLFDAEEEEKPVVLYFYLLESKWCEKMNTEYLADLKIEEFLSQIPKAAVNPDESEDDAALAETFKIKEYPAFLVLIPTHNTEPERIHPFSKKGNMTPDEFLNNLKGIITSHYNKKAFSYFQKKDHENAVKYFEMTLTYDPDDAYTYHALGIIYHTLGADKKDKRILNRAAEYFKQALKIDPNLKESKAELKKLGKWVHACYKGHAHKGYGLLW